MKKLWLFLSLLICSTLVAGCNFKDNKIMDWDWMVNEANEPETNNSYTWKYLALYPFGTEIEPKEPDYSWMTVQKLYNDPDIHRDYQTNYWKDYYFINAIYYKRKNWDSEKIVVHEEPTKEPIYFDWTLYQSVWNEKSESWSTMIDKLEWSVLITWYLETHSEPDCIYCDEEEQKKAWTVEVWRIYPDDWNKYWWFVIWYPNWNNLVSEYPYLRYDQINYFASSHWSFKPHFDLNLRDIANDWKLHTFHVILDDWWVSERFYDGSMIRERDFIE